MRCDNVRKQIDLLWDGEQPAEVQSHLRDCAACAAYHRDLRLVNAGFRLLKQDAPVEPSLGFAERLIRQLNEVSKPLNIADFFERVGRRFVYATLALTLLALLGLTVPSTGPVRGLSSADVQVTTQEASLSYSDPMGAAGLQEAPDSSPAQAPAPVGNEGK